jgi:hypothetical protein
MKHINTVKGTEFGVLVNCDDLYWTDLMPVSYRTELGA